MPSIDKAVELLSAANRPVLFLDTCILLDIIRSTHRGLRGYAAQASELSGRLLDSPPACLLVLSSIISREWEDNAPAVMEETSRHLRTMEEQSGHFHDACQALGIFTATPRTPYGGMGLAEALCDLSRSLIDRAVLLDADAGCRVKAVERVVNKIPPALRKGEVKDCTIIEEYMAVCRGLQASGFARKCVFCTSNTEDYCVTGSGLHPHLTGEFNGCMLTFTKNLPWAIHEITG